MIIIILNPLGWVNGLTVTTILISAIIIGIFFIYKSKRTGVTLLKYSGFMIIFSGLMFSGPVLDFFTILMSANNIDNSTGMYGIISYIWTAPLVLCSIDIGVELLLSEYKKVPLFTFTILSIFFELVIILGTMNSFYFKLPSNPGEDLIDSTFAYGTPAFMLIVIFLLSSLAINGCGILIKGLKSEKLIQKKYILISLGFFSYVTLAILDTITPPGFHVFIARILMISSPWFLYFGLREKSKKKQPTEKELELRAFILGESKNVEQIQDKLEPEKEIGPDLEDVQVLTKELGRLVKKGSIERKIPIKVVIIEVVLLMAVILLVVVQHFLYALEPGEKVCFPFEHTCFPIRNLVDPFLFIAIGLQFGIIIYILYNAFRQQYIRESLEESPEIEES